MNFSRSENDLTVNRVAGIFRDKVLNRMNLDDDESHIIFLVSVVAETADRFENRRLNFDRG